MQKFECEMHKYPIISKTTQLGLPWFGGCSLLFNYYIQSINFIEIDTKHIYDRLKPENSWESSVETREFPGFIWGFQGIPSSQPIRASEIDTMIKIF